MLEKALKNTEIRLITLNSMGGDVDAALAMGDLIYKTTYQHSYLVGDKKINHDTTPTVKPIKCASACVFIIASARSRILSDGTGSIIIHSPFSVSNDLTYSQIRNNMARMKEIAIKQFERVSVSPTLWSTIVNTPSSKYKVLSAAEENQFGLSNDDPAWDDYSNSWRATLLGMSKSEYMRKDSIKNECIKNIPSRFYAKNGEFEVLMHCEKKAGLLENKNQPIVKKLD
jgi:hypothetical protein